MNMAAKGPAGGCAAVSWRVCRLSDYSSRAMLPIAAPRAYAQMR